MEDETLLKHAEFESEFLTLVIHLFMNSDKDGFKPLDMGQMSEEQKATIARYITYIFRKNIQDADTEDAVRFLAWILLKSVVYYNANTLPHETTLGRALSEGLRFATSDSDPAVLEEMLKRLRNESHDGEEKT